MEHFDEHSRDLMKAELRREVGARIRKFRKELGLKQGQLASHLHFGRSNLARIEKGAVYPSIYTLKIFKREFNLSLDWLLYEKGKMFEDEEGDTLKLAENCGQEIKELWFYMNRVSMLRHAVLGFYMKSKVENREIIRQLMEEVEKKEAPKKQEEQRNLEMRDVAG